MFSGWDILRFPCQDEEYITALVLTTSKKGVQHLWASLNSRNNIYTWGRANLTYLPIASLELGPDKDEAV